VANGQTPPPASSASGSSTGDGAGRYDIAKNKVTGMFPDGVHIPGIPGAQPLV
jgi:hypothetical protein